MTSSKPLNQTDEKDKNNSGATNEKSAESALYPVWQGLKDDYRTYCGIISFSNRGEDNA